MFWPKQDEAIRSYDNFLWYYVTKDIILLCGHWLPLSMAASIINSTEMFTKLTQYHWKLLDAWHAVGTKKVKHVAEMVGENKN